MKTFKPTEGMWLTQTEDVSDEYRIYSPEIYTPDDIPDDFYRDATEEERQAWEERMSAMVEPVEEDGYEE